MRGWMLYTIDADPRQRNHSRVRVPRNSWPYFAVADSRLPQHRGQVPLFISPRNKVAQLYPPGTGFSFRRLPRLAGLQWRYSNPPPSGVLLTILATIVLLITSRHGPSRKNHFQKYLYCSVWIRCRRNVFMAPLRSNCAVTQEFPSILWNPMFITVFTRALH
jgi:hypothetical protein